MNGAQVLQPVLLGQDEHHRVVAVAAARVHLKNTSICIVSTH